MMAQSNQWKIEETRGRCGHLSNVITKPQQGWTVGAICCFYETALSDAISCFCGSAVSGTCACEAYACKSNVKLNYKTKLNLSVCCQFYATNIKTFYIIRQEMPQNPCVSYP